MYVKLHYFQIYQVTQNGSMWTWTSTIPEFFCSQQSLEGFKEIVQLFSREKLWKTGKVEVVQKTRDLVKETIENVDEVFEEVKKIEEDTKAINEEGKEIAADST